MKKAVWAALAASFATLVAAGATLAAEQYSISFSTQYHAQVIPGGKVGTYTSVGFILAGGGKVFYELTPFIEDLSFTKGKMASLGARQCRSTSGNAGNEKFVKYEMCLRVTPKGDNAFEVTAEESTSSVMMPNSSNPARITTSHSETFTVSGGGGCRVSLLASKKTYRNDNPPYAYSVTGGAIKGSAKCRVVTSAIGGS